MRRRGGVWCAITLATGCAAGDGHVRANGEWFGELGSSGASSGDVADVWGPSDRGSSSYGGEASAEPSSSSTAVGSDATGDAAGSSEGDAPISGEMNVFVTSTGTGAAGGDLGGLSGADARCQALAEAAGAGTRTWRAYLSTAPIDGVGELVHARDRIGDGPFYDAHGELVALDLDALHATAMGERRLATELGTQVPTDEHDVLTGSDDNGLARTEFPDNPSAPAPTCGNWTRNDTNTWTWVGHTDAEGPDTWFSAHGVSCDPAGLAATGGSGRTYCFAIDGA